MVGAKSGDCCLLYCCWMVPMSWIWSPQIVSGASGDSTAWMDVEVATRSAGVYLALLVLGAKALTDAARNAVAAMVNLTIVFELFLSNF